MGVVRVNENNSDVIMTASEVAKFLKVSVSAVRRWTRNGQLIGYRLGGRGDWRYLKKDVMTFLLGMNKSGINRNYRN
jgi:excisionase family DNA binding protein